MGEHGRQRCQHGFRRERRKQAVMAARLKARVAMVCQGWSRVLWPYGAPELIDHALLPVFEDESLAPGVAPITVDDEGRNLVIIGPGPTPR